MDFRLEFPAKSERDFGLTFDHLLRSYQGFGESRKGTFAHAEQKVAKIRAAARRTLTALYRGVRHDGISSGVGPLSIARDLLV